MSGTNLHTVIMVKEALTKISRVGSRHSMYLQKALVEDSAFPFKPGESLIIRIEREMLVVERPQKETPSARSE
jgi:hypothetical protein